jgi:hypothetical protein
MLEYFEVKKEDVAKESLVTIQEGKGTFIKRRVIYEDLNKD